MECAVLTTARSVTLKAQRASLIKTGNILATYSESVKLWRRRRRHEQIKAKETKKATKANAEYAEATNKADKIMEATKTKFLFNTERR